MPKPAKNLAFRIFFLLFLLGALVLIRAFEDVLFYDPFLDYFRGEYAAIPLPAFDLPKLAASLCFRYGLNMLVSLAIIYVAFPDRSLLRFTALLYLTLFLILMAAFIVTLYSCPECKLAIFYERRFLIQPLFILLFLPAFYYQKHFVK